LEMIVQGFILNIFVLNAIKPTSIQLIIAVMIVSFQIIKQTKRRKQNEQKRKKDRRSP